MLDYIVQKIEQWQKKKESIKDEKVVKQKVGEIKREYIINDLNDEIGKILNPTIDKWNVNVEQLKTTQKNIESMKLEVKDLVLKEMGFDFLSLIYRKIEMDILIKLKNILVAEASKVINKDEDLMSNLVSRVINEIELRKQAGLLNNKVTEKDVISGAITY